MASWLTSFIMRDTGRFLLLAAALIGVVFVLLRLWSPSSLQKLERLAASRGCWLPVSLLVLSGYLLLLLLNTTYPGYLEHIEPNIASVSYLLAKGAPLYHDVSSAQRYSFPYGPMAYLPYAWALQAFGATVASLKFVDNRRRPPGPPSPFLPWRKPAPARSSPGRGAALPPPAPSGRHAGD